MAGLLGASIGCQPALSGRLAAHPAWSFRHSAARLTVRISTQTRVHRRRMNGDTSNELAGTSRFAVAVLIARVRLPRWWLSRTASIREDCAIRLDLPRLPGRHDSIDPRNP